MYKIIIHSLESSANKVDKIVRRSDETLVQTELMTHVKKVFIYTHYMYLIYMEHLHDIIATILNNLFQ